MFYLLLGILALIYLCCFSTWEHMTNSDVQKKQDHHKTATTWDSVHKKKDVKNEKPSERQLRGPQISDKDAQEQKDKDKPQPLSSKAPNYPDVYGPEILKVPGHKDSGVPGSHESHKPEPYDFIPAAEFPKGPIAPSPFLTDFSKIMN
jgi:hypothetical protein